MLLTNFEQHLNNLYDVQAFKDFCPKGLAVEGKSEIQRGLTGVSFGLDLLDEAIQRQADFIVVHHLHGFWDNQSHIVRGTLKKKIQGLLEHGISLFGYHLPMDAHPTLGNNIGVLEALDLKHTGGFLREGNKDIGFIGEFAEAQSHDEILTRIKSKIGKENFAFMNGNSQIKKVGICTGAAPSAVEELVAMGDIDLYVTGEARENTQQYCLEEGINFIAAGHHQTECFGPRSLAHYLNDTLGLQTEFVNLHNPV